MNEFLRRINERWSKLSLTSKIGIIGGAVALVVFFSLLGQRLNRIQYAPLFTNIEPQDAGAIVEELKSQGVLYQLADQGQTIMVPKDQVYDLRLQLAGNNLVPNAGLGFELFDKNQLGMTDYQRHINYIRALQEELRRTIVQLDEVEQARVHLVIPEPSVFVADEQPASASIALKLKTFSSIKPSQVKGIISLVAGSVEGLSPDQVTVIDMRGNILSDGLGAEDITLGEDTLKRQELTSAFEHDMEQRVQKLLQRILGPNKAVAMVSAQMNFDKREVTKLEFGDDGKIRSQQVINETDLNGGTISGGTPTDPNLQPNPNTYPAIDTQNKGSQHQKEENTTNYEIDQTQESIVYAPGTLENLSIAVALDAQLDNQQQQQLQQLVAAAVGQPISNVELLPMTFDTSYQDQLNQAVAEEDSKAAQDTQLRRQITLAAAAGTAFLLLVIGLILLLRRRRRRAATVPTQTAPPMQQVIAAQQYAAAKEISPEEKVRQQKYRDARDFANQKTDEAVQLLRAWMAEDER